MVGGFGASFLVGQEFNVHGSEVNQSGSSNLYICMDGSGPLNRVSFVTRV